MSTRAETYAAILHTVYGALMANLLLVVGCLPLVVGVIVTDPARSWPLLALLAPWCTPALVGVFAVLASLGDRPSDAGVLRTFGRAWRASWRRATGLGALAVGAVVVLGVDTRWAWGRQIGALVIPVLAVLIVLVLATALLVLVVLAERPGVRLRDAVRACGYLAVRRWYLTLVSLAVLGLLVQLVALRPALALGLAAAPLLYLVWANSRYTLRPALDPPLPTAAVAA